MRGVDQADQPMILFSPIGTADPITALGDGPMLHIVRHYHPSVVALFLSPAVAAFEHIDHRYTQAVRRLAPATTVRTVETAQTQVHRFDLFIPEFRALLEELAAEYPAEEILLNTSSGTPAMQSALVAINAFGIPATTAIQVSTPSAAMSIPGDREPPPDYDLDLMWEANEDNLSGAANRCFTATSAALGTLLERQNLKQLITSYDYAAATAIAAKARLPQATRDLITGVTRRAGLDHTKAQPLLEGTEFAYRTDPAAEYVATLDLLRRRKQWADFARAATPAIDAALTTALARYLPENRYLTRAGQLDHTKLAREPQISGILRAQPTTKYLRTRDRLALLKEFAPADRYTALTPLVDFAQRVRNTAAHEIVAISAEKLKQDSGLTAQQLLDILAAETKADITLYDRMNAEILRQIDSAPIG